MRDGIVFYNSFWEALKELEPDVAMQSIDAIMRYGTTGEEVECSGIVKAMFLMAKPQIDANNKRYENGCKGGEYGKLGGRPKNEETETPKKPQENPKETPKKPQENPKETPKKPQENPKETPKEKDKDKVKDKVKEKEDSKESEKKMPPAYYPNDQLLDNAFSQYVDMRKKIRAPMTDRAIELAIMKLNTMSRGDPDRAIAILNQSVMNSWKGLFEPHDRKENVVKDDDYWASL